MFKSLYPRARIRFCVAAVALATVVNLAVQAQTELYGPVADAPTSGGMLNMGLMVEPPGLDPFHQAADARIRVSVLMYQGLFYESADGEAVPLLAESYEVSDDGLTYTFTLRQGVTFHTGAKMTAQDVAYSYDYIRNPDNGSPGAGDFAIIDSIDVVDDYTVRFTLSSPNASMRMTLGNKYGAVIPKGYFDDPNAKNRMNSESVGTGPFRLAEFRPNSNLSLVKHADYWDAGAPYLDGINFVFLPNSASMLVALRNGRVDLVPLSRPQDVRQIADAAELTVERWPSLNQKAIDLGAEQAPLNDPRVRKAIALAIDKEELLQASIGGYGTVIGTMVAAMQERWGVPLDQLPAQQVDIDAAKALLADAGQDSGFELTLTTINGYDWMDPAAVTVKQQLAEIGITITIQRLDLGVWINNFRAKQMGFTFNDWATQPDPNLLFYRHFHQAPEGADFRNWNNAEASALLDRGRAASDPDTRRAAYAEFQQLLADTAPTIMLFSADHVTVRSDKVRNYVQHPTGWYYGLARTWLAE